MGSGERSCFILKQLRLSSKSNWDPQTMSERRPARVIAFCVFLPQRNPAGDSTSAPPARGSVPAATRQRSAEPHPACWATTSQVPASCLFHITYIGQHFYEPMWSHHVRIGWISAGNAKMSSNNECLRCRRVGGSWWCSWSSLWCFLR